jgi:hypothetical protein
MIYPLWLKIWLSGLGIIVLIGCFPFIVVYFKIRGRRIRDFSFWQENKLAKFLIAMPEKGYSRETWDAIRPMPLLFFLVGIGYFVFYGLLIFDRLEALPAGLITLPLLLFFVYLFDFGQDAAWLHGKYTPGFFIQEIFVTGAVMVPLIYLFVEVMIRIDIN